MVVGYDLEALLPAPGPKLNERRIATFEARTGIRLPPEYRSLLLKRNGGCLNFTELPTGSGTFYPQRLFELGERHMMAMIGDFETQSVGYLPFAENCGGDYFLIHILNGSIWYWDHEQDDLPLNPQQIVKVSKSVGSMLSALGGEPTLPTRTELDDVAESKSPLLLEDFLRRGGAQLRNEQDLTIAQVAARAGNLWMLQQCKERALSLEGTMAMAAVSGSRDVVMYLLECGRDINEPLNGREPLKFARVNGPKFYRFMKDLGAR